MIRSIVTKSGLSGLLAFLAAFLIFSSTASAQVETPSQVSIQGTALVSKDTTVGNTTYHTTRTGGLLVGYSYQFSRWAGVEGNYGYTRNIQSFIAPTRGSSLQS